MLSHLKIDNIVLIQSLTLELDNGLTVLTGETGAGKSILLDALGLATGRRADAGLVRHGADKGQVSASFDIPPDHSVFGVLNEMDIHADDGLIIRRTLGKDGRSKAFVNDTPVSIGALKSIGDQLIEIHGQFDTAGLLDEKNHRDALDLFGAYPALLSETATAYDSWHTAQKALMDVRTKAENAATREDYLRYCLEELNKLAPDEGEEDTLKALRLQMMNHEKIADAHQELTRYFEDDDGIYAQLGRAQSLMDKLASTLPEAAGGILDALNRAQIEIEDAAARLSQLSDIEDTDQDLNQIESRLYDLKDCARKHNCTIDELLQKQEEIRDELALIDDFESRLNQLENEENAARKAYSHAAEQLHQARIDAAKILSGKLMAELPSLKLGDARFDIQVDKKEPERWNEKGLSKVAFRVATNPGSAPGPINKIASGGELSRFMLALKLVLAETSNVPTLIFDEVDSGVGGATADAVGKRLERLSQHNQILVVTHSPQVAARGATQLKISKSSDKTSTRTAVERLSENDRLDEIARMIAGAEITGEARAAAQKLIADKAA
tara:strand:+ start:1273 stop:2940 length:1668 start_codon:yes stop_codon:yes gene_type:complete